MSVLSKVTNEKQAIERMVAWWMLAIFLLISAFWVGIGLGIWVLVRWII